MTWSAPGISRGFTRTRGDPQAGIAQGQCAVERRSVSASVYRMPYIGSCVFRREAFDLSGGFDEKHDAGRTTI